MRTNCNSLISFTLIILSSLSLTACLDSDDDDTPAAEDHTINVTLDKNQVVDLSNANATYTGAATLEFHHDEGELHGGIVFTGATPSLVHVHTGYAGEDGPVLFSLTDDDSDNTWMIPQDKELLTQTARDDLGAGRLYLNAHYADKTTIRAQITLHEVHIATARLSPALDSNNNPIQTSGSGFAAATLNAETGAFKAIITVKDIVGSEITDVHVHDTENKMNHIELTDISAPTNVVYKTADDEAVDAVGIDQTFHGKLMINVTTQTNPNGELTAVLPAMSHSH